MGIAARWSRSGTRTRWFWAAVVVATVAALVLPARAAGAADVKPVVERDISAEAYTVTVGSPIVVRPPKLSGPVTKVVYQWDWCTSSPFSCVETTITGTRHVPTLASTGGMTLGQWTQKRYMMRIVATAYNGTAWTTAGLLLVSVIPGVARGDINVAEWWNGTTLGVYGIAAADGVDGAIPFRLRALNAVGSVVGTYQGQSGLYRTDYKLPWPNTGNWGGFNIGMAAPRATRLCLDVGLSYVPVHCEALPPAPAG